MSRISQPKNKHQAQKKLFNKFVAEIQNVPIFSDETRHVDTNYNTCHVSLSHQIDEKCLTTGDKVQANYAA